jgi:hypothetical protein
MDSNKFVRRAALIVVALSLVACRSYWEVTDSDSGRSYYTRDVDHDEGRLKFKDERTGDRVNLVGNSEVRELTRDQYHSAIGR